MNNPDDPKAVRKHIEDLEAKNNCGYDHSGLVYRNLLLKDKAFPRWRGSVFRFNASAVV